MVIGKKGQLNVGRVWILGLVTIASLTFVKILVLPVLKTSFRPVIEDLTNNFLPGEAAFLIGEMDFLWFVADAVPFILIAVVFVFMIAASLKREAVSEFE